MVVNLLLIMLFSGACSRVELAATEGIALLYINSYHKEDFPYVSYVIHLLLCMLPSSAEPERKASNILQRIGYGGIR